MGLPRHSGTPSGSRTEQATGSLASPRPCRSPPVRSYGRRARVRCRPSGVPPVDRAPSGQAGYPLLDGSVAGEDGTAALVAFYDNLVEVAGALTDGKNGHG
jgi:hypothetical protein